jgi:hypothetical protein
MAEIAAAYGFVRRRVTDRNHWKQGLGTYLGRKATTDRSRR